MRDGRGAVRGLKGWEGMGPGGGGGYICMGLVV